MPTLFRSKAGERKQNQDLAKIIKTVPAAETYGRLPLGVRVTRNYSIQQSTPIDGSRSLSRVLSPFSIELVPPLVFGNDPVLGNGQKKKAQTGIFEAALTSNDAFKRAKDRRNSNLIATGKVLGNKQITRLEAIVTNGKLHRRYAADKTRFQEGGDSFLDPQIADVLTAADIALQLNHMLNTPPLILLINPQSLSVTYNRLQQYSERTRTGYVFQHWGEEQPKLSISGMIGAFIAGANPWDSQRAFVAGRSGQIDQVSGVQFASKHDSASFQNLMSLFSFYLNNGYIHDTLGKSYANHFVGALAIRYDQWVYIGNIDSFSYGYEDTKQRGGLQFDMEFTVSQMYDTSQNMNVVRPMQAPTPSPSDPRYSTVGQSRLTRRPGEINLLAPAYNAAREAAKPKPGSPALDAATPGRVLPSSTPTLEPNTRGFRSTASAVTTAPPQQTSVRNTPGQPFTGVS